MKWELVGWDKLSNNQRVVRGNIGVIGKWITQYSDMSSSDLLKNYDRRIEVLGDRRISGEEGKWMESTQQGSSMGVLIYHLIRNRGVVIGSDEESRNLDVANPSVFSKSGGLCVAVGELWCC